MLRQLPGAGDEVKWPWPFPRARAKPLHGQSSSCCWENHHPGGKAWQAWPPGTGSLPNSKRKYFPCPSHGQQRATDSPGSLLPFPPQFSVSNTPSALFLLSCSSQPGPSWALTKLYAPISRIQTFHTLGFWENWHTPVMASMSTWWPWVSFCDSNISLKWHAGIISPVPLLELIHLPLVVKTKCCPPAYSLPVNWSHWVSPSPQSVAVKRLYRASLFEKMTLCVGVWFRTDFCVVLIINSNKLRGLGPIFMVQLCKEHLHS